MKKMLSLAAPCLLGAGFLFNSGCVERRVVYVSQPAGVQAPETVVADAPPPPRVEVIAPAPDPAFYWVPGYWSWNGGWVWVGGRWGPRPHPHAIWVGPRYVRRGHGYVYHGGYWR